MDPHDERIRERDDAWRPRPRRLLIGLGLIAVAIVWSIVNATAGGYRRPSAPVIHGPLDTRVQSLDGVRVRPELPRGATGPVRQVTISFHNDGARPRVIAPGDLALLQQGRTWRPLARGSLARVTVRPGHFVSGPLVFPRPLAAGAVLIFAPPWGAGQRLRWPLWQ